jgi:hypothetical protein
VTSPPYRNRHLTTKLGCKKPSLMQIAGFSAAC